MSDTLESLDRKINSAADLQSVVRTMKALAAASIGQYESAVIVLNGYYHTVELGLSVCLKNAGTFIAARQLNQTKTLFTTAIVFGSDQGLVGQFNEALADYASNMLKLLPGEKKIWVVGDRIRSQIKETGFAIENSFTIPASANAIAGLVSQILIKGKVHNFADEVAELYIFYNRPQPGAIYKQFCLRLLPLDEVWLKNMGEIKWPTANLPEAFPDKELVLPGLIREYLFVSLYRACAESLAAENAARLAAMQRAEKNINELKDDLLLYFHRLRQSSIDEELFDLISGSEALNVNGEN